MEELTLNLGPSSTAIEEVAAADGTGIKEEPQI